MSYSPTSNCASMVTPVSSIGAAALSAMPGAIADRGTAIGGGIGAQGSCSQYSTSRGAASLSTRSKIDFGRVFTFSSARTTGTGTTIAKSSGGPW